MKRTILFSLALFLLSSPFAAARADEPEEINFELYFVLLPEMKTISEASNKSVHDLHTLMTALQQTLDEAKAAGLRSQIREQLIAHRDLKLRMIDLVKRIFREPEPELTDLEALRRIRGTDLVRVRWKKQALKYVVRDLSNATGVTFRLQASVQELSTVELDFPQIRAENALNLISRNFDLKWILFEGRAYVFRQINQNEGRFLEYEKKHGTVDWIAEDKAGTYENQPVMPPKRDLKKVEDMDLPLLAQRLTKLYILEGESQRHELRLKELEMAAKYSQMRDSPEEEAAEAREKREKHIRHYLHMEKDNSIEVWDIINKVLGDYLEVPDDDGEFQQLLQKPVEQLRWRNRNLEEALYDLARTLDFDIVVDFPPRVTMTVSLTVENATFETVLELISDSQQGGIVWKWANGRLYVTHIQTKR